jgi:hypothetical protein
LESAANLPSVYTFYNSIYCCKAYLRNHFGQRKEEKGIWLAALSTSRTSGLDLLPVQQRGSQNLKPASPGGRGGGGEREAKGYKDVTKREGHRKVKEREKENGLKDRKR